MFVVSQHSVFPKLRPAKMSSFQLRTAVISAVRELDVYILQNAASDVDIGLENE